MNIKDELFERSRGSFTPPRAQFINMIKNIRMREIQMTLLLRILITVGLDPSKLIQVKYV